MRIRIGAGEEGRRIYWDTAASPLLNIYGMAASGKTRLTDAIMRQAGKDMAIIRFSMKQEPTPIPTVMAVGCSDKAKVKEMLESVQAEQKRRMQRMDEDTKQIMLVFDDFGTWLNVGADVEMVRMLTGIMQACRKTRMCLIACMQSYTGASEKLRELVRNSILCDAGSHIVLRDVANVDVVRPQNIVEASSALLEGCGVFESNTGVVSRLDPII